MRYTLRQTVDSVIWGLFGWDLTSNIGEKFEAWRLGQLQQVEQDLVRSDQGQAVNAGGSHVKPVARIAMWPQREAQFVGYRPREGRFLQLQILKRCINPSCEIGVDLKL